MGNVYFELTAELNAKGAVAVLTSGQAVVWYRTAIMSKDGDWILAETPAACARVLDVLGSHGARYRTGAPVDIRWLAGGWSSHFEFQDEKGRRIRCDFLTRPPRLDSAAVESLWEPSRSPDRLPVIDLESLIRTKRTQRAKDYAVIGELARRLPPEREILFTTDPDRVMELSPTYGGDVDRLPVRAVLEGAGREEVVVALARESFRFQEADRIRMDRFEAASREFRSAVLASGLTKLPLARAHRELVDLAEQYLPLRVEEEDS